MANPSTTARVLQRGTLLCGCRHERGMLKCHEKGIFNYTNVSVNNRLCKALFYKS